MGKSIFSILSLVLVMGLMFTSTDAEAKRNKRKISNQTKSAGMNCQKPSGPMTCMVCNCYNEAGNQGYEGQVAVGKVVMTRVGLPNYPDSICGVVKQRKQFSWLNKGMKRQNVPANSSCFKAMREAIKFKGYFADHYYAPSGMKGRRKPAWARGMDNVRNIGGHKFFASASPRLIDRGDQSTATRGIATLLDVVPALNGLIHIEEDMGES